MELYIVSSSRAGNICNYMLNDLKKHPQVTFVYEDPAPLVFQSRYIRKLWKLTAKMLWRVRKRTFIKRWICAQRTGRTVKVLITNEAMQWISASDLEPLRSAGVSVNALLIDPLAGKYPSVTCARELISAFEFDKILTFDPKDAKENGWIYCNQLYSAYPVVQKEINWDLVYVGAVKNRLNACLKLIEECQRNSISSYIRLLCFDKTVAKQLPAQVRMRRYLTYPKLLELTLQARCVFDTTQEGQSGTTLRYYEAVVYNKKLLTNNPHITELPFYDSRYMRVYNETDDIDWDWVKNPQVPDYGYDGRYSPIKLLSILQDIV